MEGREFWLRVGVVVLLAACLVAGTMREANAASPAAELAARLEHYAARSGAFRQKLYDETGELLESSAGEYRILRPGYFSWEVTEPDRQLIIATPEFLWHYDLDLETATRRPVTGAIARSPLQVLGGDMAALQSDFAVNAPADQTFELLPVDERAGFTHLRVRFDGNEFVAIEVIDSLQQRIELTLSPDPQPVDLSPQDFDFEPPATADVLINDH